MKVINKTIIKTLNVTINGTVVILPNDMTKAKELIAQITQDQREQK